MDYFSEYKKYFPELTQRNNGQVKVKCPFHEDHAPSLSLHLEKGFFHCFGCGASGSFKKFLELARSSNGKSKMASMYEYQDEKGNMLFQVVRYAPKGFKVRRRDENGLWQWGLDGARKVLYRLPDVLASDDILIVEGEKDADTLRANGFVATTNPFGAGKWEESYSEILKDKRIVIIPDTDEPGQKHARDVAGKILVYAKSVKVIALPFGKDVSEYLEQGGTKESLTALMAQTGEVEDNKERLEISYEKSTKEKLSSGHKTTQKNFMLWPQLASTACHGLAGEIVRAIEPHTEADPAALLSQLLVSFGNVVGSTAHFTVEADKHTLKLFMVLVGLTSKGRKGTSWGYVKELFAQADEAWADERIQSGLSSGEGLIWAVRDPVMKREAVRKKGKAVAFQNVEVDAGVDDKRLLVFEPEFASTLRVMGRDGNTLSAVIRQAWDSGNLRAMTKNNPAKATGTHISIIGHVTKSELCRYLNKTEAANGFANRFLWLCVKRSKILPEGGRIKDVHFAPLIERLRHAIQFARNLNEEITRDEEARMLWKEIYPELSKGKPGISGAMTSRGEAQVMRLSCLYALLDLSAVIKKEHLQAALSLWKYSEDSCRYIFGDILGDPIADEIREALCGAPEGMTRTEISHALGRHKESQEITQALSVLFEQGLARMETQETGGRASEVWVAV